MINKLCGFLAATVLILSACTSPGTSSEAVIPTPAPQEPDHVYSQSPTAPESSESAPPANQISLPDVIEAETNGISIKVDPMMELLTIVQYLSGYSEKYDELTHLKTAYLTDIDSAFQGFRDHDAVKYFEKTMDVFNYEKPPTACLYLNRDFSIREDYSESVFAAYNPADMTYLSDMLKRFCLDTNFNDFFESHSDFYREIIESYRESFPDWNMIAALEAYYGKSMQNYHIVLVPLMSFGGFGPQIGENQIFCLIGTKEADGGLLSFGNEADITDLVLHEFGHSFVPIADYDNSVMIGEVARSEYLMAPIQRKMESLAYPQWSTVYEELVLRAAVIDISMRNSSVLSLEAALRTERNQGFVYIDDVYAILQQYNENRDKYTIFDSFVPVITDYLLKCYPEKR